jgi:hypothetical protein
VESRLVRFIRELKIPGVILFIMVTVWAVGYSGDLERKLRGYRLPAPPTLRVKFDQDETPAEPAPSTLAGGADGIDDVDDD